MNDFDGKGNYVGCPGCDLGGDTRGRIRTTDEASPEDGNKCQAIPDPPKLVSDEATFLTPKTGYDRMVDEIQLLRALVARLKTRLKQIEPYVVTPMAHEKVRDGLEDNRGLDYEIH